MYRNRNNRRRKEFQRRLSSCASELRIAPMEEEKAGVPDEAKAT